MQQPKDGRYAKNAGAVFNLSYHIVWRPKYRRKVLVGDVEQRLKHILYATAQQYRVLIETMQVMPDHVHLFVSSDPTRCVSLRATLVTSNGKEFMRVPGLRVEDWR